MAFAGGCGARVRLAEVPHDGSADDRSPEADAVLLFSESASRFVIEVQPANGSAGLPVPADQPWTYDELRHDVRRARLLRKPEVLRRQEPRVQPQPQLHAHRLG